MTTDDLTAAGVMSTEPRSVLAKGRWFGLLALIAAALTFVPGLHIVALPVVVVMAAIGMTGGPLARGLSSAGLIFGGISALITFLPVWTRLV